MKKIGSTGLIWEKYLIPDSKTDIRKWAVVACDQYTSDGKYWQDLKEYIDGEPSALDISLPEYFIGSACEPALKESIIKKQHEYAGEGGPLRLLPEGAIAVRRDTTSGERLGLIMTVDLDTYSFDEGVKPLLRPTEDTIRERFLPRMELRRQAALDMAHILILYDDKEKTVQKILDADRGEDVYDFCIYPTDRKISGEFIPAESAKGAALEKAFGALLDKAVSENPEHPLLFAVGDGNHSLAAAKACWEEIKKTLPDGAEHPARYAMAEFVNIYDDSMVFEPIYRIVSDTDPEALLFRMVKLANEKGWGASLTEKAHTENGAISIDYIMRRNSGYITFGRPGYELALANLQQLLDEILPSMPSAKIDYVHGEDTINRLSTEEGSIGFIAPPCEKGDIFGAVGHDGKLPRKTFSIGQAEDKRYYLECRKLK